MTLAELASLPQLPTLDTREEVIDGERVTLPAFASLVSWRLPEDPACVHDEHGRAWEVVRVGDPPHRFKLRRRGDDCLH
jgi:hypothetical protein